MWLENTSPLYTINLKDAIDKPSALKSLLPYLFDMNNKYTISMNIEDIIKLIQRFSLLYVCRSNDLGLNHIDESDIIQHLHLIGTIYTNNKIINIKPSKMLQATPVLLNKLK